MALAFRKLFAVISVLGLCISVASYFGSFFGLTTGPTNEANPWIFFRMAPLFFLGVFLSIVEFDGELGNQGFFLKRFKETRPPWGFPLIYGCALFWLAHFAYFLLITHAGSIKIVDGEYVLDGFGSMHRVLNQREYLTLTDWETRFFTSFCICLYLYMGLYWSFPRVKTKPGPYDA